MNKKQYIPMWDEEETIDGYDCGSTWNGMPNIYVNKDTFIDVLDSLPNTYHVNDDNSIDMYMDDHNIDTYTPDIDGLYYLGGGAFCFMECES